MNPEQITQRFPLVARSRPPCPPLETRVRSITKLARNAAEQPGNLALVAATHNQAALLASDCGLPDLARSLCWQHYDLYQHARPLNAITARYALEPIVNLARLHIRNGRGNEAFELLDTLHDSVRSHTDTVIDNRQLSIRNLVATGDDHRTICEWLWAILLAEGTRALTSAGRWQEALTVAERRNGVGQRLLDGRQVAIIASCLDGKPTVGTALLDGSQPRTSWEHAVAACLRVLCEPTGPAIATMVEQYLGLDSALDRLFRARLGLAAIDLAGRVERPLAAQAEAHLIQDAVADGDGYVARDVLAHDGCRSALSSADMRTLSTTVRASGLDTGTIPPNLMADLMTAVRLAGPAQTSDVGSRSARTVRVHSTDPEHHRK